MSFRKVLVITSVIGITLVSIAAITPIFFKDKILNEVKKSINKNLNAKVNFQEVDLSIIHSFPYLELEIGKLTVAGVDSFATDTLASIEKVNIDINLMSVIDGSKYQIRAVKLQKPTIHAKVLKSGKANWDIIKADTARQTPTDTAATRFKAALKEYEITGARITFKDESSDMLLDIDSLDHKGQGDFTEDRFTLSTSSNIEKLTFKFAGIPYLSKVKLKADLPIEIDMKQMKFTLAENRINLNELLLSFTGNISMPNEKDMVLDLKFNAAKSDLKNFLSLIPAFYSSSFKDMAANGKFGFDGTAKGIYNEQTLPAFNLNFIIDKGKVQYPGLPSAINNIQVRAEIKNSDGVVDHTIINVPSFHLEFGNFPMNGKLTIKNPISDPFVDLLLKGKLDLKQLTAIFPMEGISLAGIVDADVKALGNKSSIDRGFYQNFKVSGYMTANQFNYSGKEVPMPVLIPTAKVTFNPRNISLTNFSAKIGKSDLQANGTVDNYLEYAFKKNSALQGQFNVTAGLLDVNELVGPVATSPQKDTTKLTIFEVPGSIDFNLELKADRVIYDNYNIREASGNLIIRNQTVYFKNMGLQMLDGNVRMNGSYATTDIKKPKVDIDFGIENMNIQKAFSTFNTVKLLAPVAKYTSGTFSTKLSFNSDLDQDMMPLYSSMNIDGVTNIIQAIVQGFEPLNKLSLVLNTDKLQRLELNNVLTRFKIANGKLNIAPFTIKKGDFSMVVEGFNGLDQSLSYKFAMDVPRAYLGTKATGVSDALLAKFNNKTGSAIELGETVKVNALMTGSILKPSVKIISVADDTKSQIKTAATQFGETKKAQLQAKATQEATALLEKSTAQIQQKADTLKKQVEEKAKEQMKKKLKGLLSPRR